MTNPETTPETARTASTSPASWVDEVDQLVQETDFSGVVRVDIGDDVVLCQACGLANRAYDVPITPSTQFAIASGTKGLTALAVVGLVEDGSLGLDTTARSILGPDLPLIDDDVTIEHLLAHRSGIGDYVDEESDYDIDQYLLPVPVHELATTADYIPVLDGHPPKFRPDERFAYCNGGYVVLALIAERVSGQPFHDFVTERVCVPAGMRDTAFLRSDELPGHAAVGYLAPHGLRANVFHLPVRGSGDGGIYSTAADIHALWTALFNGRIVSSTWVERMTQPRSDVPEESMRYGLGFWLHETRDHVMLEGADTGVSFRTVHDPTTRTTHTVISNTARGAWPVTRRLDQLLNST